MKWEEPPTSGGFDKRKNAYEDEAEALRSRPGEWGVVVTFAPSEDSRARSTSNSITKGKYVEFRPAGSFEAVSRKVPGDDGNEIIKVYARYVKESGNT
jgi:hypothetical protein